jgi:DNA-binding transcriptional MerR regulator
MFYDRLVAREDAAIRAFPAEKVQALTGLTRRRLQYWDEKGFLQPSVARGGGRGRARLYDFRDVVALRVAADLRRRGVSLQEIRRAVQHLRQLDYAHPLAEIRFYDEGGRLYFEEADTVRAGRRPEQVLAVFHVPFQAIVDSVQADIAKLDERPTGQIWRRRGLLGSKPVIAGTRIPIETIQRLAAGGATVTKITELYPDLTEQDIRAALAAESAVRRRANAN